MICEKCYSIRSIFWDSIRPLKLLTLTVYPLAILGLYLAHHGATDDTDLLLDLQPWWVWAGAVAYVFIARLFDLLCCFDHIIFRRSTPILGVIFWSMLLASNLKHPETLAFGTMFGGLAVLEGWILARAWMEK